MKFSPTSVVSAVKGQVSCDLDGEEVILNTNNGVYYGLDPVGARIWELIQEPSTIGELRDAIVKEYDVDSGKCESDLLQLLEALSNEKLIMVTNDNGA